MATSIRTGSPCAWERVAELDEMVIEMNKLHAILRAEAARLEATLKCSLPTVLNGYIDEKIDNTITRVKDNVEHSKRMIDPLRNLALYKDNFEYYCRVLKEFIDQISLAVQYLETHTTASNDENGNPYDDLVLEAIIVNDVDSRYLAR